MPINEHRRLVKEARAIIDDTKLKTEALTKCVAASRTLVAESRMLLARSESLAKTYATIERGGGSRAVITLAARRQPAR